MVRIRRFGVVSTSNVFALLYFVLTLIFIIPFLLLSASGPMTFTDATGQQVEINVGAPIFLLIIPFIYAALGWIFTAIFCLLYNLVAGFTGGIAVQTVHEGPPPAPPQWQPPPQQPAWQQPPPPPPAAPPPPSEPVR